MVVNVPGLIAVIVFYIVILVTGIWASRKSRKEEKKCTGNRSEVTMVGGRNIHVFIGIFTMTATWVGGGYILGTAEAVYVPTQGLIWALGPLAYVINFVVGGIFFAKPMRSKQYVTMMDPFQQKYGNTLTSFLLIPAFIGDVLWVACVLSALGGTMSVILDISSVHSILISALVAIVYTLLGGLYSVAYTDVIQLTAMLISLGLCIPFVMRNPASTDIRFTAVHELFQAPWIGKLELSDAGKWIDDLLIFALGGVCYQSFYQRVLSAASPCQAQVTCFAAAIFSVILAVPSVLIGATAVSTDWNQTSYGLPTPFERGEAAKILPISLQHLCPSFISIAGIGAITAAVMSSVDSAMLSSASLFARNIYKNILRKTASENEVVWVVRVSVLVVGLCGTGLAVTADTVYGFWLISGDVTYTVLFSQLICVLYFPSTNSYGAAAGFVVGAVLRLLGGEPVLGIPPVIHFPYCRLIDGVYVQYFPFRTLAVLLSSITIMLGSFLASVLFNRGLLPERWDVFQVKKHNDKILRRSHYEETCLDDKLAVNEDSPVEKKS
ncbi:high-affinity choline transporter 1-like [Lepisosteus oculatus]|uniref:high-affinity choline transporter 1-like n=1 Tax=Lepisosteus oculatus TaxID=7918 RepID=UPI0037172EAC